MSLRPATSRDWLTTGEVADLLGVSQQTVIRMCDRRLIRSWKIPGSKFRRIAKEVAEQARRELHEQGGLRPPTTPEGEAA